MAYFSRLLSNPFALLLCFALISQTSLAGVEVKLLLVDLSSFQIH